jgi:hypothetical protein
MPDDPLAPKEEEVSTGIRSPLALASLGQPRLCRHLTTREPLDYKHSRRPPGLDLSFMNILNADQAPISLNSPI